MDAGIRIPGTSLRFGLDPILGLIPGGGDAVGAVLAGWILVEAIRMGASRATVLRIAGNVALDAGVGVIPFIGDIFDFAWKANLRNVALLERHLAQAAVGQHAGRVDDAAKRRSIYRQLVERRLQRSGIRHIAGEDDNPGSFLSNSAELRLDFRRRAASRHQSNRAGALTGKPLSHAQAKCA